MLGYLSREEVQAILAATDASWTGRRDHLLFQLLYNTGARVSELISARGRDALAGDCRQIQLHGKGRKQRAVPLWRQTQTQLRRWIKENKIAADMPLLPNRFGQGVRLNQWLREFAHGIAYGGIKHPGWNPPARTVRQSSHEHVRSDFDNLQIIALVK